MTAAPTYFNEDFVPQLRDDIDVRVYEAEAVAWSAVAAGPVWLDPVAALVCQIVDGQGSIGELTNDVVTVFNVPQDAAAAHVQRSLAVMESAGLIESTTPPELETESALDFFPFPPSS